VLFFKLLLKKLKTVAEYHS